MPTFLTHLITCFRLLGQGAVIKLSVLFFCAGSAAYADASQPCPPLTIETACSAQGTAALVVQAGPDAPAGLSYLISVPAEGVEAISLAPGASLTLDLPDPSGRQITVAVVGLEPEGGSLAACCLSNQRVHLPAACAPAASDPAATADDLAINLTLSPACIRQRTSPVCSGTIAVTGTGTSPARVTLSAELGEAFLAVGADCSAFAGGRAICRLPVGQSLPFDLSLSAATPRGQATLCAEIGIGEDEVARTLSLQDALARAGYPVGVVDGVFGPATLAALAEFVADAGLPPLTSDIPPEVLFLLGIGNFTDAVPDNNRACVQADVPPAPLVCDARTTRASGDDCACRFKGMVRISTTTCACEKGHTLGAKGCETVETVTTNPTDTASTDTTTAPACDPATTVLRGGVCECRSATMTRASDTACRETEVRFCPDGSPELPGVPCAPVCARLNAAGECCDDLGPEDASCR